MAAGGLKRPINVLAVIASALLWLTALIWFAQTAQNSETLSRLQNGILLFSFIGIMILFYWDLLLGLIGCSIFNFFSII